MPTVTIFRPGTIEDSGQHFMKFVFRASVDGQVGLVHVTVNDEAGQMNEASAAEAAELLLRRRPDLLEGIAITETAEGEGSTGGGSATGGGISVGGSGVGTRGGVSGGSDDDNDDDDDLIKFEAAFLSGRPPGAAEAEQQPGDAYEVDNHTKSKNPGTNT
ncbi:hypothetical protein [Nocardia sp. CA-135398]|uniref:hypothetical protein n=1 Tax=Nocardia sp. CA-135398 TaxID=3239977 RepID=UPI003D96D057